MTDQDNRNNSQNLDPEGLEAYIEDVRKRQSNVLWPQSLANSRSVDAFLWRGLPDPSLVQRIGAVLFGLVWASIGAMFLLLITYGWWGGLLFGLPALYAGVRFCWNGLRPSRKPPSVQ